MVFQRNIIRGQTTVLLTEHATKELQRRRHFTGIIRRDPSNSSTVNTWLRLPFDTLKFVEKLKLAGISEAHAKAEAEALVSAFSEAMDAQLATKSDIYELKTELIGLKGEVGSIKWMMGVLIALAIANFAKQFF